MTDQLECVLSVFAHFLDLCHHAQERHAHLAAEGELRYREFNDKNHKKLKIGLAKIHVSRIGKLDRAEKRDHNAEPPDLPSNGEEAPF